MSVRCADRVTVVKGTSRRPPGPVRVPSTLAHRSLAAVGGAAVAGGGRDPRPGGSHFTRAKLTTFAIVDVVSRKWIATVVTAEESSTQVQLLFAEALDAEGLVAGPTPAGATRCCWPCPTTAAP